MGNSLGGYGIFIESECTLGYTGIYSMGARYDDTVVVIGDWILETGIWNDFGKWMDTELWID